MRPILAIVALILSATGIAHPGNGIVVLDDGSVLTGDAVGNGIWLFREGRTPELVIRNLHCHWLTSGLDGNLYAEAQGNVGDTWLAQLYQVSNSPWRAESIAKDVPLSRSIYTADREGRLVYLHEGRVVRDSGGVITVLAEAPKGTFSSLSGLAWDRAGVVHFSSGARVYRAGPDKRARMVAEFTGRPTEQMYANGDSQRIWGIDVDSRGRILVALASDRRVVRIESNGSSTTVATADDNWIATGVAAEGDDAYLFETKLVGNRNLGPRVRRVGKDGRSVVLGVAGGYPQTPQGG